MIHASPDVPEEYFWLTDFINNDIHSRYFTHLGSGRTEVEFFFGYEQSFNCPESNCIMHNTWHFQFMEVLETDHKTVQSEYDTLIPQFATWVNQLTENRFPNITFTHSSLIGDHSPTITSYRYC